MWLQSTVVWSMCTWGDIQCIYSSLKAFGILVKCTRRGKLDSQGDVTRIINPAVTTRFFADAYFLTSADHRRIFSTLNHVVKVRQRTSGGRVTVRRPPDSLRRWQNFRPMSRRRSAGAPAVTAGAPAGRRRTTINPTIIGRS